MKSIVVFCGSSEGYDGSYREAAFQLGETLAARHIRVVFGGAKVGLMGALAEGVLEQNGNIVGVIPSFLRTKEVAHEGLTQLITVETMHERKLKMHELSDGIIAMPGGWGTMEELFEMLTWGQLGLHKKPVGLLNINGYYDALKALSDNMVQEGFLSEYVNNMLLIDESIEGLLEKMSVYEPIDTPKWITRQAT